MSRPHEHPSGRHRPHGGGSTEGTSSTPGPGLRPGGRVGRPSTHAAARRRTAGHRPGSPTGDAPSAPETTGPDVPEPPATGRRRRREADPAPEQVSRPGHDSAPRHGIGPRPPRPAGGVDAPTTALSAAPTDARHTSTTTGHGTPVDARGAEATTALRAPAPPARPAENGAPTTVDGPTVAVPVPRAESRPAPASATATPGRDTPVRAAAATSRLIGVDVARGLALFGIIAVHALVEGTEDGAPTTNYLVFGGRSAALFALLAGVAFAFMTGRRRVRPGVDAKAAAATLATRAGALLVLGLALGWTDPEIAAVILPYYAVMFLLAIPLVLLPTGALAGLAVVLAGGLPVLSAVIRPGLPVPTLDNPHLVDVVTDPLGLLSELTFTGAYPALTWVTYLCVGIAVGRLRLSSLRTGIALVAGGAAAALAATGVSWWLLGPMGGYARIAAATPPARLETAPTIVDFVNASPGGVTPTTTWWWMATVSPHSGAPLDLVHTIGSALAVLGAALLLAHVPGRLIGYVLRPVAAAGSMTLTLYTVSLLFMNSPLDDFDPVQGYLWQVAAAMLIGVAWKRAVGRGPLEGAMSLLAHAARDRARRGSDDPEGPSGRPAGRDRVETADRARAPVAAGNDRH